jgi:hypothetical protein
MSKSADVDRSGVGLASSPFLRFPKETIMSYVHITRSPGMGLADYRKVAEQLGPTPITGRLSHHVGEQSGALLIVDVWEKRADADRFTADRLFPAFAAAGTRPDADTLVLAFEDEPGDE